MCHGISPKADCPVSHRNRCVSRGAMQAVKAIWTTGHLRLLLAIAYITCVYGQIE
jgi:hypothetical protein